MKIAVTYENGKIFQHFGHCEQFKLYDVEDKIIKNAEIVSADGQGHGALAVLLQNHKVDTLICGGIGGGARQALADAGISLFPGAQGEADAAVNALLNDSLVFDPNTMCSHHEHHGAGGCGEDKHGCHGNHGGVEILD